MLKCVSHPHRTCIYARGGDCGKSELDGGGDADADADAPYGARRVRPISRAPDGRFILTSSRSSSISSSTDDGGFLTHPAFRELIDVRVIPTTATATSATLSLQHDLTSSSQRSEISLDSRHAIAQGQTPRAGPAIPVSVIYSSHTPFLSSSPASTTIWSPLLSPTYFSDLSSVRQPSSVERTARSNGQIQPLHDYSHHHELPSLEAIREENERILNSYSPSKVIRPRFTKLPGRHTRYARSAPELMPVTHPAGLTPTTSGLLAPLETSPDSRSSSSGLGSKNTSQQTSSPGTGDWKLPPYRAPPPPPPRPPSPSRKMLVAPPPSLPTGSGVMSAKPHYMRTWLDYTPSPTHSVASNKPLSVDDHYEFDPIFPASPTPTELVLTPLPPTVRAKTVPLSTPLKQNEIEARVQAMKEEFHEFKRRQAQMKRLKDMESMC